MMKNILIVISLLPDEHVRKQPAAMLSELEQIE